MAFSYYMNMEKISLDIAREQVNYMTDNNSGLVNYIYDNKIISIDEIRFEE